MADLTARTRGAVPFLLSLAIAGGVIGPFLGAPTVADVLLVAVPGGTALAFVLLDARRRPPLSEGIAGFGARLARARHAAVIVLGPSGEASYWNRGAEEIFGLPPAHGGRRDVSGVIVPPGGRDALLLEVSRALEDERDSAPRRRLFVDGEGRAFEAVSILCPSGGEAALVVLDGRGSEVSAERRGRLADHLPAGVLHLDPWGRVEALSPRLAAWAGRNPERLEGLDAARLEFLPEAMRNRLVGLALRRGFAHEEVYEEETRVAAPDGTSRTLLGFIGARPGGGVDALFLESASARRPSPLRVSPPLLSGGGRDGTPSRVLFVEDNDEIRDLIAHVLRSRGVEVSPCANGPQALELFSAKPFDLVLLDLSLPGMDGFEILREIRSRPAGASVPVVALTAYASEFDRERAMAEGMDDFVAKPVTRATIDALLGRWIFRAQ